MRRYCLTGVSTLLLWLLSASPALAARDYYLSQFGSDTNSGASPAEAWLTVNRLNFVSFEAGDRILLAGGSTFAGNLVLAADDAGTSTSPIVVSSYGTGRATIDGGNGTAIQIYNTAGISITNLAVVGAGASANTGSGISAYTDLPGDVKLRFVHIEGVNASGFGMSGVEIGGNNGTSGFQDVTIKFVAAWSNGRNGISSYGPFAGAHRNVYVGYSKSFSNPGIDHAESTGNGIVLGAIDGAIIERSVAHENGTGAIGPHGPIGIWTYHSNNVTIQYNEAYSNRTGGWADGGGFALDVGVTNSILQYNYTHGNDGSGLLLAGGFDPGEHANNIVRYNVSQNDSRRNGSGALEIWGKTRNTHIYNNTVFTTADAAFQARALYITNGYAEGNYAIGVSFRNNILNATGGIPNVEVTPGALSGASLRLESNNYYSPSGDPRILWGGATYSSVSVWASVTGQEMVAGRLAGTSSNPLLISPGGGGTFDDATRLKFLTAYRLRSASPLIDAGVDVSGIGLQPGPHDFVETPLFQGGGYDVGAHEWTPGGEPPVPQEIVLYARDATGKAGNWALTNAVGAADGSFLRNADFGAATVSVPAASPADYVDITFDAESNTRYRLWLRLRAEADSKFNDSVYVQFSDAVDVNGTPVYRIGTTAGLTVNLAICATCPPQGWGWQNRAYWLTDTGDVWFAASGSHTIRIQVREDGVGVDQIVLSPSQYLDSAPGKVTNDATIVPKPSGTPPPPPPPPPPNVAPTIALTSPVDGATFTALSAITVSATANDSDGSIARVDFYAGSALIGSDTSAPHSVSWTTAGAGTYTLTADATDDVGARTTSAPIRITVEAPQMLASEVVIYARDLQASGGWTMVSDASAAAGLKLLAPDQNWSSTAGPVAAPTRYFDVTFAVEPNTRYRMWLRLRAEADSKFNDSVYVQFSDAVNATGTPIYRIGTTAGLTVNLATCGTCPPQGWGWQNRAYWLSDTGDVWFANSGSHTMRVQVREDGVGLDQIVLSPKRYLDTAPGSVTNDATIVQKPSDTAPPNAAPTVTLTSPASGATFTALATITVSATADDSDGSIARVDFYANGVPIGSDTAAPYSVSWTNPAAGSYTLTAVATDNRNTTTTSAPVAISVTAPQSTPAEIVVYASEVSSTQGWLPASDASAAAGAKLITTDEGWSSTDRAQSAPPRYFDLTFHANANTRYRLWIRLRAGGNSKFNDSVWVQFSGAVNAGGAPIYMLGTTQGLLVNLETCSGCGVGDWGWQNRAYWLAETGEVYFASTGPQTMRVQVREDGVQLDQIVLSPKKYLDAAPGPVKFDATIVAKP